MLNYSEALEIIRSHFQNIKLKTEKLPITDCIGKTLAEEILSDIYMPSFDNSAMDGFAVKYYENVKSWEVIGEISAGNYAELTIRNNKQAIGIMTGAKLPNGADTVIPVEDVDNAGNIITLKEDCKISLGKDVRFKGENIKLNEIAIKKNTVLTTQNLTMGAACGRSEFLVYSPLKIGILTSGDELIDYTDYPSNDKVRATNSISLELLIRDSGMHPVQFGSVRDNKEEIKNTLEKALESDIDLLLTCGGVSVGNYDYVKDVLLELGAKLIFWKVNIKPGKPLLFCTYESKGKTILIFGLPGNPVSTFVGFNIFIKPLLKEKYHNIITPNLKCIFQSEFKQDDGKKHFVNGYYNFDENTKSYFVEKVKDRSSGNIANLGNSNCLFIVDENRTHVGKGEEVECIIL